MFAGVVTVARHVGEIADRTALHVALAPYHQPEAVSHWSNDRVLVVEHETVDSSDFGGDDLVLFWGRLDNRDELQEPGDASLTDRELVALGWRRQGADFLTRMVGDFACAVVETRTGAVTLIRDPVGVKPLHCWPIADGFAFATSIAALRRLSGPAPTPDPEWIALNLLGLHFDDPTRSPYREIENIAPGTIVRWNPSTGTTTTRWHQWLDDSEWTDGRDERWVDAYREVLEEAVRCRIPATHLIGAENSGGLDSTTITSFLGRLLEHPEERLEAFGLVNAEREPNAILTTSIRAGVRWNHLLTAQADPRLRRTAAERALRILGHPEDHGVASGQAMFYEIAASRGVRTMFSGFGGDEVVTHNGALVLTELADRGDFPGLLRSVRGNVATKPARAAKHLIKRRLPGPSHHQGLHQAFRERWPWHVLRDAVVAEFDLQNRYFDTARYDAPFRTLNGFIVDHLLRQTWVAARLSECTLVAGTWGIDYRWPLLDSRLIQQYLTTPSREKFGPGISRYLHRRAVRGIVPDLIVDHADKDMGASIGPARGSADDAVAESLYDLPGSLADVVDRARLESALERATSAPLGALSWRSKLTAHAAWLA